MSTKRRYGYAGRSLLAAALLSPVLLGACYSPPYYVGQKEPVPSPFSAPAWHTIAESSEAAAEALMAQAGHEVDGNVPVLIGSVSNIDNVETSSSFGRLISEQVGARFVQAGYDVREVRMSRRINVQDGASDPRRAGEYVISRDDQDLLPAMNAGAVVFGTYSIGKDRIMVNMRMVQPGTGKVLAAHGYSLVKDKEVNALLEGDHRHSFFSKEW